jgi:hypothetical protein
MHHEGVDVEIPDDSPECAPALDISVIGGTESLIFNLPSGLPGYAIALRLVRRKIWADFARVRNHDQRR